MDGGIPMFHLNEPKFLKLLDLSPEEIIGLLDLSSGAVMAFAGTL